ncbi:MAG: WD40/YVTN/BNR-like repeat-containing protein, partial [Schleiferiaceae bacterium]
MKLRLFTLGLFAALQLVAQPLPDDLLKNLKFRSIGPAGMSGRVTAIDVDPRDERVIYAGSASGGLWKSVNAGQSWTPIWDEQPNPSIGAVRVDPSNPDVIWVGTGEGNPRNSQTIGGGLFRSLDGGKSWQAMGLQATKGIHRIVVHPRDPNTVWVAAIGLAYGDTEDRGVYKTSDGGKTWRKVLYRNNRTGAADLVIDPVNPNKLFAAMWEYRRWPWFFKSG